MNKPDLEDTQPTSLRTEKADINPGKTQPVAIGPRTRQRSKNFRALTWGLAALLVLIVGVVWGGLMGYRSGGQALAQSQSEQLTRSLHEQFTLGEADLLAGSYDIARQRFEYVFNQDPNFPGVAARMAEVLTILYATATPTPFIPTPTVTLTPTRDIRPVQDRWTQILEYVGAGEWSAAIESLIGLRKDEPGYEFTRTDGLLFLALRQRGVNKIYQESNLEGGIYDLALAENFGPLDLEAEVARNMARLYLYGSSFWEAYPERAVYFFGQVAAAVPYLRDASGWTATERYRGALIQYGDQFARLDDWCSAWEQYQLAAAIRSDAALGNQMDTAALRCQPPTETFDVILTPTPTASPTITPTGATLFPPTDTVTPESPTDTPFPLTDTPAPPTDTPVPPPTEAPTETPTETPPTP